MAEQNFSWLTENSLETIPVVSKEEVKKIEFQNWKDRFLVHKKALLVISALFALLLVLKFFQKEDMGPPRMSGMAALMPIPKGQLVEGMLIRPIFINPNSLSKSERVIRLVQEDAEKVMGKVRAKKDIPPHKPILWTDLELIPPSRAAAKAVVPVVTYPEN